MITIQIDGKTYQIIDLKGRIKSAIEEWISAGYLEEVKENKEMPDIVQREKEAQEGMKQVWDSIRKAQDPSILEKLREELEKRKQKMIEENWGPSYIEQVVWTLAVLDSLEQPKEEPTEKDYNDMNDEEIAEYHRTHQDEKFPKSKFETPQPQFTPGQMIEVSNDGEKWYKRVFNFSTEPSEGFWCESIPQDNSTFLTNWKYARPLPQEDIELPPFKFEYANEWSSGTTLSQIGEQVSRLTSVVNQLIKANKK